MASKILRKIKTCLPSKRALVIFLCFSILIGLLFPPQSAKADLLGIIDTFSAMFEGIEEEAAPLAKQIVMVFVAYIVGLIALYTSSNLLDLVIKEQSHWLTVKNSPLVQAGWHFTSGLANLFLILIFVAIAIAYILKIETFQAKKALPRLIIVALLLNFSLVFIGVLIDISNIFYNTVLQGNEGLATQFIDILGAGGSDVWMNLILWMALLAGLWIVPFIGPFAQLAFVLLVVGLGFAPNIMTWVFQIVLFLMISGVFFTWVFLFAVRVYLIQILAILAPLAFICLILPQTRKYWDDWLKHLISWTFLGIFLLFFFAIGIKAAKALVPPGGLTPIPFGAVLGWGYIASYFTYYFFLFIYLILVSYVSSRFMPALASFIITQATSWGNVAWQRAIKPFGEVFKKSGEIVYKEKIEPKARPWLEKQPLIGKTIGGPGAYEAELKKRTTVEKKKLEGRSAEDLQKIVEMRAVSAADRHRRAAAMEILAEKRKLKDEYKNYLAEVKSYGGDTGEILKAMPHWAQTIGKTPKEIIEKMSPGEFRNKVQPESLGVREVFYEMNLRQIEEIGRRGTAAQKEALRNLIRTQMAQIWTDYSNLIAQGLQEEADNLARKVGHIEYHPDFK
jgi:hypothetical protein